MQKLHTFFQQKNIRILYIESAKTVNEMTLNELVKLASFEQPSPGPGVIKHVSCSNQLSIKFGLLINLRLYK